VGPPVDGKATALRVRGVHACTGREGARTADARVQAVIARGRMGPSSEAELKHHRAAADTLRMLRRIGTTSATAVAAVVLGTGTAAAVPAHVATAYVTPADGSHLARGAPVDFSVRTQAGAQVAIVVATMSLTDPQGRLFSLGAFGSLAHASPGDPGLYRWTAPARAPLRRRPGTFYWQARVLPPGGTVEY